MYLHFNNRRAKCIRKSDTGQNAEFYWTWQVYIPQDKHTLLHQGFSTGCEIDDGFHFNAGREGI